MSRRAVAFVIDRLLADEYLRRRFARDRIATLAELSACGARLTPAEIELFLSADIRLWWLGRCIAANRADLVVHATS